MSALHNTAHPSVGLERPPSRLPVLDDFNALCCLLVIMIHVMSLGITDADPTSWQGAVVFVPWLLSRCAVPGFLFSGGMKMGLELARDTLSPYGPYILRRAKKVYFPYLFWTLFYYLCFLPIGYVRGSLAELGNYLWFGSLSAQFYYVLVVMQLYLLRPLWRQLVRHGRLVVHGLIARIVRCRCIGHITSSFPVVQNFLFPRIPCIQNCPVDNTDHMGIQAEKVHTASMCPGKLVHRCVRRSRSSL